jgi:hypothetical protein
VINGSTSNTTRASLPSTFGLLVYQRRRNPDMTATLTIRSYSSTKISKTRNSITSFIIKDCVIHTKFCKGTETSATSYYISLVKGQNIATIPSFTLESGSILEYVPVAYSTWGALNKTCDNAINVCQALTGSSDASDWWGPLMSPGRALDYTRYFIFCEIVLGSPYGSASALSKSPVTGQRYRPAFPKTTIRDDVRYVLISPV